MQSIIKGDIIYPPINERKELTIEVNIIIIVYIGGQVNGI